MAKRILVTYSANARSTQIVTETIGTTLSQDGVEVDVRQLKTVSDVSAYDAVILGGPMIVGWHKATLKFLISHQRDLSQVPVAYFLTAMRLTKTSETDPGRVSIYQAPGLAKLPQSESKLRFRERYATAASYLKPPFKGAPLVQPVSAGFFGGKLDYRTLNVFQRLFVMLIAGAQPGGRRSWEAMWAWGLSLRPVLLGT